ncbi:Methyltransferase small domain-containing protein [Pseudomonas delhiensis]|uniref:Methyltransferase small domain-containing protein n=1 Tax=Pseudomonas delhiensis TaxID=366289 RepID=A0A239LYD4_9PSED|nr:class I SAM-dependent methyltransferase [Pseudomonas delhiensis]SDI24900.1 Methyltransferase small domain-containing protein [Pseudomonas delhiensis]SNT34654.1 Methyltransferase small domain-containing protein [Pseudomonas delhiensis]
MTALPPRLEALLALGLRLRREGYAFVTVSPASHARVNAREENALARDLRDIFGWSRPFADGQLERPLFSLLAAADLLHRDGRHWRSKVRWSSLEDQLFVHSAYPTQEAEAVFFGPDTYRFARAIGQHLQALDSRDVHRAVDIGCGAGPGAILLAGACPRAEVHAVDINPHALAFTRVNALLAEAPQLQVRRSDLLEGLAGDFDLMVANPPYMLDPAQRTYRHGGGSQGAELSLRILESALGRLAPGGSLLLYTGAAVIDGEAPLWRQASRLLAARPGWEWRYEELDPDVFGEELEQPAYRQVERIAAVLLTLRRLA